MPVPDTIAHMAAAARAAALQLPAVPPHERSAALVHMAAAIRAGSATILAANAVDLAAAADTGLAPAMIDRLMLDEARVEAMAAGVEQVAGLPDPVGTVLETRHHANGMRIEKVRVGLGVLAVIYESRPNVTADAAALALKAGNAVILRGGSEARHSTTAIHAAMAATVESAGMPAAVVQLVPGTDRADVVRLVQMEGLVDLVIPRGGEGLIRAVTEHARVPVLKHYKGVCHVYVDAGADAAMAREIVVNAKCQRPGVCNAMETLLVHADRARDLLPELGSALAEHDVVLRGDEVTCALVPGAQPATEDDWDREYLDLVAAVRVVDDLEQAIRHINTHGSGHSDVIVTADASAAARFARDVDSATVYVNASSRFTDGFEFGMGAEIGISTDKLHARGPCGVESLTTYKYVIHGTGQVRR